MNELHGSGLSVATADRALLRGLNLDLYPGQCVALVGESGSGKSLTALTLMGLLPKGLTASWATLADGMPRKAMVFQEPMSALNPTMRIGRQVAEAAESALGLKPEEARDRALEELRRVQVPQPESAVKKYPHQLSGGQRQRVMIAMAMAMDPELLICDEPTTALDHSVAFEILDLLRDLQRERGMAMLFISHDWEAVAHVADQVIVLRQGEVVESGSLDEVMNHPKQPYTQGLLASRPPEQGKPIRLPTVQDFLDGIAPETSERPVFEGGTEILSVRGLRKSFKGTPILHGVDLWFTRAKPWGWSEPPALESQRSPAALWASSNPTEAKSPTAGRASISFHAGSAEPTPARSSTFFRIPSRVFRPGCGWATYSKSPCACTAAQWTPPVAKPGWRNCSRPWASHQIRR